MAKLRGFLQYSYNRFFNLWQRLGFHVTPVHYYMPIPDTSRLKPSIWEKRSELVGIDMNEDGQKQLLSDFMVFKDEYDSLARNPTSNPSEYYVFNKSFGSVDGEVLYSMIRKFKPNKILEIGSGFSTMLSSIAIQKNRDQNTNYTCELEVVDPYPKKTISEDLSSLTKINKLSVEDFPLSTFEELGEGDFLFIDSSHVVKIGNDVQYLYLEVLPRLKIGVKIHIHDIFAPMEYRHDLIYKEHLFWSEQYLLQAFLTFNDKFRVIWAGSYMHIKHPELLRKTFASYDPTKHWPGSFWLQRVK